jgi:hypothetical protein
MTRYIVFDKKGIIHESDSYEDALDEFYTTDEFDGDLIFVEEQMRRR